MKNEAILERKWMEISLYTPTFFTWAGSNVHKTYFYFLKLAKKYYILSS